MINYGRKPRVENLPALPTIPVQVLEAEPLMPQLTVETVDNHIYFYSEVNSDRVLALLRAVRETAARLRGEYLGRELPEGFPRTPIWLHIQSDGGDAFAAFSAADQLKQMAGETPVYSIVEGVGASAATIISMACEKRFIRPSAFMLIHQLSGANWGTFEQMKDAMGMYEKMMSQIVSFYVAHSKLGEEAVKAFLQRDSWFGAAECVDNGMVDEVLV